MLISGLLQGRTRSEAIAVLAVVSYLGLASAAHAVPPTVSPSPGYDARLAERRAAVLSDNPHRPRHLHPRRAQKLRRDPR